VVYGVYTFIDPNSCVEIKWRSQADTSDSIVNNFIVRLLFARSEDVLRGLIPKISSMQRGIWDLMMEEGAFDLWLELYHGGSTDSGWRVSRINVRLALELARERLGEVGSCALMLLINDGWDTNWRRRVYIDYVKVYEAEGVAKPLIDPPPILIEVNGPPKSTFNCTIRYFKLYEFRPSDLKLKTTIDPDYRDDKLQRGSTLPAAIASLGPYVYDLQHVKGKVVAMDLDLKLEGSAQPEGGIKLVRPLEGGQVQAYKSRIDQLRALDGLTNVRYVRFVIHGLGQNITGREGFYAIRLSYIGPREVWFTPENASFTLIGGRYDWWVTVDAALIPPGKVECFEVWHGGCGYADPTEIVLIDEWGNEVLRYVSSRHAFYVNQSFIVDMVLGEWFEPELIFPSQGRSRQVEPPTITVVELKPRINITANPNVLPIGGIVEVSGVVQPPLWGKTVILRIYSANGKVFEEHSSTLDEDGSFRYVFKPNMRGRWRVEAIYGDVKASTNFEVVGLPDLIVTSLWLSKTKVAVGDWLTFSTTVRNQGEAVAEGFTVAVYLEPQLYRWPLRKRVWTSPPLRLEPGEEVTLTDSFRLEGLEPGGYTVSVVVDPQDAVRELREGNNVSSKSIKLVRPLVVSSMLIFLVAGGSFGAAATLTALMVMRRGKRRQPL